jgi:hypothetical protein
MRIYFLKAYIAKQRRHKENWQMQSLKEFSLYWNYFKFSSYYLPFYSFYILIFAFVIHCFILLMEYNG